MRKVLKYLSVYLPVFAIGCLVISICGLLMVIPVVIGWFMGAVVGLYYADWEPEDDADTFVKVL